MGMFSSAKGKRGMKSKRGGGDLDFLGQESSGLGYGEESLSNDQCRFLTADSFIWVPMGEPGFPSLKI